MIDDFKKRLDQINQALEDVKLRYNALIGARNELQGWIDQFEQNDENSRETDKNAEGTE